MTTRQAIGYLEIGNGVPFDRQLEQISAYCHQNKLTLLFCVPEFDLGVRLKDRRALKKAVKALCDGPAHYIVTTADLDYSLLQLSLSGQGKGIVLASETQQTTVRLPLNSFRRAS